MRRLAVAQIRSKLEPLLEARGLAWEDALPVLELLDSLDELRAALRQHLRVRLAELPQLRHRLERVPGLLRLVGEAQQRRVAPLVLLLRELRAERKELRHLVQRAKSRRALQGRLSRRAAPRAIGPLRAARDTGASPEGGYLEAGPIAPQGSSVFCLS